MSVSDIQPRQWEHLVKDVCATLRRNADLPDLTEQERVDIRRRADDLLDLPAILDMRCSTGQKALLITLRGAVADACGLRAG